MQLLFRDNNLFLPRLCSDISIALKTLMEVPIINKTLQLPSSPLSTHSFKTQNNKIQFIIFFWPGADRAISLALMFPRLLNLFIQLI